MVPALGQIDVLDISGRLTIQNSADEKSHGSVKAGFHCKIETEKNCELRVKVKII